MGMPVGQGNFRLLVNHHIVMCLENRYYRFHVTSKNRHLLAQDWILSSLKPWAVRLCCCGLNSLRLW
jgi:hypothetical protein